MANFNMNNVLGWRRTFQDLTRHGSEDYPISLIFSIQFYFKSRPRGEDDMACNLLGLPSKPGINMGEGYTAYQYLLDIGETERAKQLYYFITMLSYVSCNACHLFDSIEGVGDAIKRDFNTITSKERKKITINLDLETIDTKWGTIMDLYRNSCFDWENKKEIVPSNLRKFDMGIFVFQTPLSHLHMPKKPRSGTLNLDDQKGYSEIHDQSDKTDGRASSKYYEFRNCEIDYNCLTDSINTLEDFSSPKGKLIINFDDCYEVRYNEFLGIEVNEFLRDIMLNKVSGKTYTGDEYTTDYTNKENYPEISVGGSKKGKSTLSELLHKGLNSIEDISNIVNKYTGIDLNKAIQPITGRAESIAYSLDKLSGQTLGEILLGENKNRPFESPTSKVYGGNGKPTEPQAENIYNNTPYYKSDKGLIAQIVNGVPQVNELTNNIQGFLTSAILGNVHTGNNFDEKINEYNEFW